MNSPRATDGQTPEDPIPTGPSAGRPPAAPGSAAELVRVAVPLVLSSGSLSLMNAIDRMLLAHYSPDALGAVTPAGLLHWTAMSLVIGTATCVATFVAQYEGAGRKNRVAAVAWQGVYLSLTAGVAFLAVVPLSGKIFAWAGHTPAVQRLEVEYFSVLCFGAVPMTLCAALSGFFSGRGKTIEVMAVNAGLAVTNITLDWLLIFGTGPFPEWGIRGAAAATVVSYVLAAAAYFFLMSRPNVRREYGVWAARHFDRELFARMLKYGLPTGAQLLADLLAFTLFIFLIGRISETVQVASNMALNLNGMAFVPLMGLGTAVTTLVGRRVGERRPLLAVRTTWTAAALGIGWMIAFAAVYLTFPDEIISLYGVDIGSPGTFELRRTVAVCLRYVAAFSVFDAMVIVFSAAIRGAGDTRFPMVFMLITSWLLMFLPVAVADAYGWNGLHLSWGFCTFSIALSGVGMMLRFMGGKWKTLSVIETESHAADHRPAGTHHDGPLETPPVPPGLPFPLPEPPPAFAEDSRADEEELAV